MDFIVTFQWGIFISLEVLSLIFLIAFLTLRYTFSRQRISALFLLLFIVCIVSEASLAFLVYQRTGEIGTFHIIIGVFIIYALTLGISDFKKLDRYFKVKIGNWRGVNLLTEEDTQKMQQAKDPKFIARKNRIWWYSHATIFVIVHFIFWVYYGDHTHDLAYYLSDLSWWKNAGFENSPFQNEVISGISKVWILIFLIDTIITWSYTLFPSDKK